MSDITLGIIGGGQLGSMMAIAAKKLNIKTVIFCDDVNAPAQNFCNDFICGSYDDKEKIFLPDRYIKGECPKCGAQDQYGDSCESCGATYTPTELKNPLSVLSGTKPMTKDTNHYFFNLKDFREYLIKWTEDNNLQPAIKNKLQTILDLIV